MRYERTPEDTHIDTVWYEIDMLRFALQKLSAATASLDQPTKNLLIEGALLHYRNLIRFFSGEKHRGNDVSTAKPENWAASRLTTGGLAKMREVGKELEVYYGDISCFLQHVTARRANESMSWDLNEMYDRLKPALEIFEKAFPQPGEGLTVNIRSTEPNTSSAVGIVSVAFEPE
jgi:hypothetical protein